MSKRYGRNQKRKHRERIAELERQLDRAIASSVRHKVRAEIAVDGLETLKREVEAWDREIRRLLGDCSAFRKDPAKMATTAPIWAMPVFNPAPTSFSEVGDVTAAEMVQSQENMRRYVVQISSDQMRLAKLIRLVETNASSGHAAYCLSDHLVKHHGFGERDMREIATEIASELTRLFNENRPAA